MHVTDDSVPVVELITVIKESIKEAGVSTTSDTHDIKVTSVRLILEVVASESIGGGLHFRVPVIGMEFSTGGKVSKQDTHTIEIELVPPPPEEVRGLRDVEETLVSAIETIRAAAESAAAGDDPWVLSSGTVDISFVITKEGSISLGVEGELSHEVTHQIQLGLGPA